MNPALPKKISVVLKEGWVEFRSSARVEHKIRKEGRGEY